MFEYISYNLDLDIKERIKNDFLQYHESEIWYIIASIITALAYMEKRDLYHGDIRP